MPLRIWRLEQLLSGEEDGETEQWHSIQETWWCRIQEPCWWLLTQSWRKVSTLLTPLFTTQGIVINCSTQGWGCGFHEKDEDYFTFLYCSTRRCFKWKARRCEDETEKCGLLDKSNATILAIQNVEATLSSPNNPETRSDWGKQYFCIYNVSLGCSGNAVEISLAKNDESQSYWPQDSDNCENYVAFYANQENSSSVQPYCGRTNFINQRLESSSFLAILWSTGKNDGFFKLHAKCTAPLPTAQPAINPTESSGDGALELSQLPVFEDSK